jgi:Tfp pilus assembly protein PilZ
MFPRDLDPERPGQPRCLRVRFDEALVFREEYERNLSNGGLFVPTEDMFDLRELVEVELVLAFCGKVLRLPGEVVDWRPPELASAGVVPGVAVQILDGARELRARLQPFASLAPARPVILAPPGPADRRDARRAPARVPARIASGDESAGARTRDLSTTGALISMEGQPLPVGDALRVTLVHPTRGQTLEVPATVVRHIEGADGVMSVAVRFAPEASERRKVERFVEEVQATEHARKLGGIAGSIAELGVPSLLQMFAAGAQQGTLFLASGGHEGTVVFERGMLLAVRLGAVSGLKALVRLLAWREGTFEFRGSAEAQADGEPPLPLDAALLEAMRQVDELARSPLAALPPRTAFTVRRKALERHASDLDKNEQAVLDLATAGAVLGRICDVIPVADAEIYAALASLVERGVLAVPDPTAPTDTGPARKS